MFLLCRQHYTQYMAEVVKENETQCHVQMQCILWKTVKWYLRYGSDQGRSSLANYFPAGSHQLFTGSHSCPVSLSFQDCAAATRRAAIDAVGNNADHPQQQAHKNGRQFHTDQTISQMCNNCLL